MILLKMEKNKNQSIDDKIEEMKIYFNNLIINNQIRGDYNLLYSKIDNIIIHNFQFKI